MGLALMACDFFDFMQQGAAVSLPPIQRIDKNILDVTVLVVAAITDGGVLIAYQHHAGRVFNEGFIFQGVAKPQGIWRQSDQSLRQVSEAPVRSCSSAAFPANRAQTVCRRTAG